MTTATLASASPLSLPSKKPSAKTPPKIEPRRKTGTCAQHQRELSIALKRARHVALLPYAPQHLRP